jgi:hypothetical protein
MMVPWWIDCVEIILDRTEYPEPPKHTDSDNTIPISFSSYMSPNAGGGGVAGSHSMSTAVHRSTNKPACLMTDYLSYDSLLFYGSLPVL